MLPPKLMSSLPTTSQMSDEDWRSSAKCRGLDPNLFVPSGPGGSLKRVYQVCNGVAGRENPCPVRSECDEFATAWGMVGVFGGVMHSQRTTTTKTVVDLVLLDARLTESEPEQPQQ